MVLHVNVYGKNVFPLIRFKFQLFFHTLIFFLFFISWQAFVTTQVMLQRKSGGSFWTGLNDRTSEGVWIFNGATALPNPSLLWVSISKVILKRCKKWNAKPLHLSIFLTETGRTSPITLGVMKTVPLCTSAGGTTTFRVMLNHISSVKNPCVSILYSTIS